MTLCPRFSCLSLVLGPRSLCDVLCSAFALSLLCFAFAETSPFAFAQDDRVSKLLATYVNEVLTKGSKINVKEMEETLSNIVFIYG